MRNGLGSAFVDYYKFQPKSDKMIGIYLKNCPEWILVDEGNFNIFNILEIMN